MATTTNFGWETPDDTDLVKDGALAMRTLGNSIDTSFVDLKGGTTGQILSKASNTDLDYTWINNDQGDITAVTAGTGISGGGTSGAVTITNSMATEITASGDIIIGTGSGTFDNLPIGTTGQVLTADTTVSPYKVKWASPAGGGKVLQVVQATTSTQTATSSTTWTDTGLSASITPSSASSKVLVLTNQAFQIQRSTNKVEGGFRLMRDSTRLMGDPDANSPDTIAYEITGATFVYFVNVHNFNYLDSPSTTSAITYKTQSALQTTANSAVFLNQPLSLVSSIILMEIGA